MSRVRPRMRRRGSSPEIVCPYKTRIGLARRERQAVHIGNNRPRHQLWMFLLHARIDVVADVAVRPAVESAVFQRSKIIRRKIIPEAVAFRSLSSRLLPVTGSKRQPHWIPQPVAYGRAFLPSGSQMVTAARRGSSPCQYSSSSR